MKRFFYLILLSIFPFFVFSKGTKNSIKDICLVDNSSLLLTFSEDVKKIIKIVPELEEGEERLFEFVLPLSVFKNASFEINLVGEKKNRADLLTTEFTTKGNKRKQDRVEVYVAKDGFIDDIYVFYSNNRMRLGSGFVHKGEYIVVTLSEGLSQNEGYIELRSTHSLYSSVIDRVEFSKKGSVSYSIHWSGPAIDPTFSTTKRSICRIFHKGEYIDTNTSSDFYISDENNSTFAKQNTNKVYKKESL